MTYLDNKKIFFSLIDEYAPNVQFFTEDDDVKTKVALLYAPAYQELADIKTRSKLRTIEISKSEQQGYDEYSLPKCKQVKKIIAQDDNNNIIDTDYYFLGENIYISNAKNAKYVIEYIPFLTLINEETEDDFELELDQDLQVLLPYKVASDLFKTDPRRRLHSF